MSGVTLNVLNWTEDDVAQYLKREKISDTKFLQCIHDERVDGKSLLTLSEQDIRDLKLKYSTLRLGDLKHFWIAVRQLQKENQTNLVNLGIIESPQSTSFGGYISQHHQQQHSHAHHHHHHFSCCSDISGFHDMERISPPLSIDGRATSIKPEIFKTMISLGESYINEFVHCFHIDIQNIRHNPLYVSLVPLPFVSLFEVSSVTKTHSTIRITQKQKKEHKPNRLPSD